MKIVIETDFSELLFLINRRERNEQVWKHVLTSTLFLSVSGPLPRYQSLSLLVQRLNEAYGSSLDVSMLYDRATGREEAPRDWWEAVMPEIGTYLREMRADS